MPTCICEVSLVSKGLGFYVQMHVHDYAFSRKGELGTCAVISLTLCDPMDRSPPVSSVHVDAPVFLPGESHGQRSLAGDDVAKSQTHLSD